ncbi:MAG: Hsp70 family protein [Candidatus Ozemobacteraceae bacterium]
MISTEQAMNNLVVGIDLGTTNSELAFYHDGRIEVVATSDGETIMPSVIGLTPDGRMLIGTPAKNQALVYPERTIMSVKRQMGSNESLALGEASYRPQEVSAMILRELKQRAETRLGRRVEKAVITVPAFFSDAQRQATHEAGVLAGFEVLRILNEPTAASLAYEGAPNHGRLVMVYDLGGGTFDVSIVETHDGVTEVLASHGDTHLGGDDFDRLLLNDVIEMLIREGKPDPRPDRLAMSRLLHAVIQAKHELSTQPYVRIREEHLLSRDGVPIHADLEVTRQRYEELIHPLVERTFVSVAQALRDAGKTPADLDAILLVGGMTRTPLVERRLEETLGKTPRHDVHPDLAVAIGAGMQAARLSGHDDGRVLVDITPYSFGPDVSEEGPFGFPIDDVFAPIIRKGSPLPARATEEFCSMYDGQDRWNVMIYQGENKVASRNILIGNFVADGFAKVPAGNPVLCTLEIDLDGILHVTVVEKRTGLTKRVKIENAMGTMARAELAKARQDLDAFFAPAQGEVVESDDEDDVLDDDEFDDDGGEDSEDDVDADVDAADADANADADAGADADYEPVNEARVVTSESINAEAWKAISRARTRLATANEDDRSEIENLMTKLEQAMAAGVESAQKKALAELDDLLYFLDEQ